VAGRRLEAAAGTRHGYGFVVESVNVSVRL
jgi:hypothetical protein